MELFTYLMTKKGHNLLQDDLFSYVLAKEKSGIYVKYTGTSLSINNTLEGKMKITLKGQCKQDSTTGKQLFNKTSYIPMNCTISYTNGLYVATKTGNSPNIKFPISLPAGNYTLYTKGALTTLMLYNGNTFVSNLYSTNANTTRNITLTQDVDNMIFWFDTEYSYDFDNLYILSGTYTSETIPPYEPYTGGQPSPSPDFPQQIHEVSGDNTIEVSGKNRLNPALLSQVSGYNTYNSTTGLWTTNTGTNTSYNRSIFYDAVGYSADRDASKIIKVKPGTTYTLKFYDATMVTYTLGLYKSDGTNITSFEGTADTLKTFTTPSNCEGLDIRRENPNTQLVFSKIMLIEGTYTSETIPPYEPYGDTYELSLGDIKMRGIGTYEDYFVRNSGKNLLNIPDGTYGSGDFTITAKNGVLTPSFSTIPSTKSFVINTNITLEAGTYTFNSSLAQAYPYFNLKSGDTVIAVNTYSSQGKVTFTLDETTTIDNIYIYYGGTSFTYGVMTPQIEVGSEATIVEPYGTGQWCKYNAIGEVVLDGSESYDYRSNYNGFRYTDTTFNVSSDNPSQDLICSHFIVSNSRGISGTIPIIRTYSNTTDSSAIFLCDGTSDVDNFKTWLSTHNTTIYYKLATPYLSLIEDTTLIEQLDNIQNARSYNTQTNINQTNNDEKAILEADVLIKNE